MKRCFFQNATGLHRLAIVVTTLLTGLLLSSPALAQEKAAAQTQNLLEKNGFSLDVQADVGTVYGEAHEIVYLDILSPSYRGSELIWDINSVLMAGGTLTLKTPYRLTANASFWAALTEGQGSMDDYDWLMPFANDKDQWTDHSHSMIDVTDANKFDFSLAVALLTNKSFSISALLGYRREHWSWEDTQANFIYSVNGIRDFRGSFSNYETFPGITYEQNFEIPYIGFSAEARKGCCSLNGYVLYSPLVSADDTDHHVWRDNTYENSYENGQYIAVGAKATFDLTSRLYLQFGAEYQDIPTIRGDTTINGMSYNGISSAGISQESMAIKAALGCRL